MKTGDYFYRDEAILNGYTFKTYFEYYMVYQKDRTFVFVNYITQIIEAILNPKP